MSKLNYNDLQMKANGLHSGTKVSEKRLRDNLNEETHIHPTTGETVILHSWVVPEGSEGDVAFEFEVIKVISTDK